MVEEREKRRKKILKAAERLFAKQGFHSTEVELISKAAGVSKGSVYNYFKNKADILFSVIEDGLEGLNERMREGTKPIKGSTLKLKKGIEIYVEHLEKNRPLFKILVGEHLHIAAFKNRYYKKLFSRTEHLERLIRAGIENGEMRNIDPYIAATCLNGMIDFLFFREVVSGKKYSAKDKAKEVTELYLKGILT
jgi:TetR/AcrR family fatty acid metabolism transcriptional regulator